MSTSRRDLMRGALLGAVGAGLWPSALESSGQDSSLFRRFEAIALSHLPTPLEAMPRLTRRIGGPSLLIKRDDQTGLAFGGNKARKLDYIFADVLRKRADVVVTWAGVQSNWARQTAAAACRHGIRPVLVLTKSRSPVEEDGNLLLDRILGADVRLIEPEADRKAVVDEIVERAARAGSRPYVVPVGGSRPEGSMEQPLGAVAYARCMAEILEQAKASGTEISHLVVATGSGGTQAGLVAGARALGSDVRVVGISVSAEKKAGQEIVAEIANATLTLLGREPDVAPSAVTVFDEFIGEGYGVLDAGIAEAVALAAREEGILLDPVYTGKAMRGLIDLAHEGYFASSRGVVFLHTGGTPALFPYRDALLAHLDTGVGSP